MEKNRVYMLEGSECLAIENIVGPMDDHPLWICKYLLEDPNVIKTMQKGYLEAGTDILKSVSYQISIEELVKSCGLSVEKSIEVIQSSVHLARTAWAEYSEENGSTKKDLVGGSVGPYGALQHDGSEYTGTYIDTHSVEMLMDWHRPRISALVDAGVDFLIFETFPSVKEARAALKLLREFPNQKAWVSFTCKDGNKTAYGESFGESVAECWKLGRDQLLAVGCNCTDPRLVTGLLQSARAVTSQPFPFVVYPNSGETFDTQIGSWSGERLDLGSIVGTWLDLGTKYIGGCCRTDLRDIRPMRLKINDWLTTKTCQF